MHSSKPASLINEYDERDEALRDADSMREMEPRVEFRVVPYFNNRFALFAGSRESVREFLAQ